MARRSHRPKTHVAKLFVGLTRSRTARCRGSVPAEIAASTVDDLFHKLRSAQLHTSKVGATRYLAKGLWKGHRERTAVYEVQWFAGGKESYRDFRLHIDRIARTMASKFCQDSVLVVHREPTSKTSFFVSPRRRRRAVQVPA